MTELQDLDYLLQGIPPRTKYTLHRVFQYFNQNTDLATKLCLKILVFEDPNLHNSELWTALHVAVRFNQIGAIKFALDHKFDFQVLGGQQGYSLMHIAVLKSNYEIIRLLIEQNVSLFDVNWEGVMPRRMALQTQVNLKMIRKFEQRQIQNVLHDSENINFDDDHKINQLQQIGIKNNCKNTTSRVPQMSTIKIMPGKEPIGISILSNSVFVENALAKICEKLEQDYYHCMILLIAIKSKVKLQTNQFGVLVSALQLPIPFQQGNFINYHQTDKFMKELKKNLTYQIQEYQYRLKQIPEVSSEEAVAELRKTTSTKLTRDIKNYAPKCTYQNMVFLSQSLYRVYAYPELKIHSNAVVLQQYEQIQNTLFDQQMTEPIYEYQNQQMIILEPEMAYRVQDPIDVVLVKLTKGSVEIFGEELLIHKIYEFPPHHPFSIFTWVQSEIQIQYRNTNEQPGYIYSEEDQPYNKMMLNILKINNLLEQLRQSAMKQLENGPRVLVIGSKESGKNTMCKTLINYSLVYGWKPIFVDLDPDQQSPGTLTAKIVSKADNQTQKLQLYFGHVYHQMKENSQRILYQKLVSELGDFTLKKLEADKSRMLDYKKHFLSQYQVQDLKLTEMIFEKYQEDRDEKDIFASGMVINCPTFIGHHSQIVAQIKQIIQSYGVDIVISIDLPDVFREIERVDIIAHKLEKLRGIVIQHNKLEENINALKKILSSSYRLQELFLYELQMRDDNDIIYQRSKSLSVVRSVIGVLHLKQSQVTLIEEDKSISKQVKDQRISELIFSAPLAFLSYVDSYDNGYLIQIPNKQCSELLQYNVCLLAK